MIFSANFWCFAMMFCMLLLFSGFEEARRCARRLFLFFPSENVLQVKTCENLGHRRFAERLFVGLEGVCY